ncbi:SMC-Scp complex subunit ScpB [Rossellomorea vietnamensis]|uniref:Segregation and condensation protein B n=1 Tax=Rossellomorea vietnamensis TaxID=218284 RepID=A0A6I6UTS0_9BACI|nr:SMC-Scp complex subunit ScpB [Rossellomorea vietnamensis]QHE62050.1 SMC-Scp complex subunit ScpB [Rossellomorea vietnamensis]
MSNINWKGVLESLLFAAGDEGLSLKQVCSVLEIEEQKAKDVLEDLKNDYENDSNRGIYIIEIAGTFQLVTKKRNADYLKKLVESPHVSFLSQAALETLAIIAYKQPITRMEIEQIRGVKTERPIQTLTSKGLVKEVGRAEGTGRAFLFGTTKEFLDYFGLKSIEELPPLPENIEDEFAQDEADLFFEKFQETMETNE